MPVTEAPGLVRRTRKTGQCQRYWIAPASAKEFRPRTYRFDDDLTDERVAAGCRKLQADVEAWRAGKVRDPIERFDGTFGALCRLFQTEPVSRFGKVKWVTRQDWAYKLRILEREVGGRLLSALGARDFDLWHQNFAKVGPARAGALMGVVRMVIRFGVLLELGHCDRLAGILTVMRFESGKRARVPVLTAEMATAFRRAAHERGRPSLALATAIQFETALRQRDVIGEYVPEPNLEPGPLVSTFGRWTTGLVWGVHIDPETLIMSKPTSKSRGRKTQVVDLRLCPMVMEELSSWAGPSGRFAGGDVARDPAEIPLSGGKCSRGTGSSGAGGSNPPRSTTRIGPVIINERTGQPWAARGFAKAWRAVARAAGIPDEVQNMDARAGAITEASLAGVPRDKLMALGTHGTVGMSERYDREQLEKTTAVREAVNRGRK